MEEKDYNQFTGYGLLLAMMKQKVYVDTSVIVGIFDPEFTEWSMKLFTEFKAGTKIIVLSDLTLQELEEAPEKIRLVLDEIPDENKAFVLLNDDEKSLANSYINEDVVTEKYLVDAQHIAIATCEKVNVVVSWNFRHIVNLNKIRLYNAVNLKYRYDSIEIRSPREVLDIE